MRTFISAGLLALAAGPAWAQTQVLPNSQEPWGSWVVGTVQLPGSPTRRWGGFAEVQVRNNGVLREYFYHELKGGASFDVAPNFTASLAGGRYSTSDYRDLDAGPLSIEKRLWEQVVLVQHAHRLTLEHRYRIEQRWFTFRDGSTAFRQRYRYRLNAFLPLNRPKMAPGTVFLAAYDEIFINPRGPVFERNRVYGGLGYQVDKHFIVQVGYVNQANYNYTNTLGQFLLQSTAAKNNVVLNLTYRLLFRSTADSEALPTQPD